MCRDQEAQPPFDTSLRHSHINNTRGTWVCVCVCVCVCVWDWLPNANSRFKPANISQHSISWPLNWAPSSFQKERGKLFSWLVEYWRVHEFQTFSFSTCTTKEKAPKECVNWPLRVRCVSLCVFEREWSFSVRGHVSPCEAAVFKDGWSVCAGNQTCVWRGGWAGFVSGERGLCSLNQGGGTDRLSL